jgi:hypothetical protein
MNQNLLTTISTAFKQSAINAGTLRRIRKEKISLLLLLFCFCSVSHAQVNLNSGLVAYFPFNGDANDYSGNANHGKVHGATLTNDRFGKTNGAYIFDGVNDYINVSHNISLNMANSISILVWVKLNDTSTNDQDIISKTESGSFSLVYKETDQKVSGNRFCFFLKSGNAYKYFYSTTLNANSKWICVAATYNDSIVRIFIDGNLNAEYVCSGAIVNNKSPLVIGNESVQLNDPFDGLIDDIRIYNRALSTEEVKLIYTSPQAKAGPDQTVNENTEVTLNGSESSDLESKTLKYLWTAPEGITLSDNNVPNPKFIAPEVKKDTTFVFSLVVNDDSVSSFPDQVAVTVKQVNKAPVANAGNDQTVGESIPVTLDGLGSYDHDRDALTYLWIAPVGITLNSNTIPNPIFISPDVTKDTTFIFNLVVKDGVLSSVSDQVLITLKHTNKEPLDRCLVAYYPFNGDANDQITGKEGLVTKATLNFDRFSKEKSSYSFNGNKSEINLGVNPGINSIVKDYTISYWIKRSTFDYTNRGVILSASGSCLRFFNGVQGVGKPVKHSISYSNYGIGKDGATRVTWKSSSDYPIGNSSWYNITVVRSGNRVYSYINGTEASDDPGNTDDIANGSNPAITKIGCSWTNTSFGYFSGSIDDIRFYNRALSAEEVKLIYTSPQAKAGPDQTVDENAEVTLDGSGSTDDLGSENLKYLWTAPKGITLNSYNIKNPKFIAPEIKRDTTFVFSLVVNDGLVSSFPDRISVKVKNINIAPVANAGSDQTVNENVKVTLNGSASSDPDGDTLTYLWTAPVGITLNSNNVPKPVFSSPEVKKDTTLIFKLVVNDGIVSSVADQVSVMVKQVNNQPTANAGNNQTVDENKLVALNGSGSWDSDGDPLTYQWTPPSGITLSSNTVVKPTFTAPEVTKDTTFTFSLIVNDGTITSVVNAVLITVKQINKVPVANAGSTIEAVEGNLVTLDGFASYDPDGDPLTFKWTVPAGIILSSEIIAKPTFTAPWVDSDTSLTITLVVNDGSLNSKIDTVMVDVVNGMVPNNLILSDTTLSPGTSNCFGAIDSIILAGNGTIVLFENGSSTTLIAGKSVLFLPGFHSMYGSFMDAYITTDGTFCEGVTPMVSVEKSSTKSTINNLLPGSDSPNIKSEVIIFPNPTNGQLTIETTEKEHNSTVLIYNSIGACIAKTNWINSQRLSIDISGKQKGLYVVRIIQNGNPVSRKIILE